MTTGGRDTPNRHLVLAGMEVLRGRWAIAVLAELALGEKQYKELVPAINAVEERAPSDGQRAKLSDRVLSDTLRRMIGDELIERRSVAEGRFPAVWYRLTPHGRALLAATRPLAEWARQHRADPPGPTRPARPRQG